MLAAVGILGVLGACGGDGGDSSDGSQGPTTTFSETDYLDALEAMFAGDQGFDGPTARCVGGAFLDAVGTEALNEAGITPDQLVDSDDLEALGLEIDRAEVVADTISALAACDITAQLNDVVVANLSTDGSALTEPMVTCIGDHAADRLLTVIAESFVEFDPRRYRLPILEALGACPTAFVEIVAATFTGADGRTVTPQARTCLESYITRHPDHALRLAGDQQEIATLFEDLATACHPIFPP